MIRILRYVKDFPGKGLIRENGGHVDIVAQMLIRQDLLVIGGHPLGIVFLLGETLSPGKLKSKI